MGKSNKQKSSKGGKNTKASTTPECKCQDFYKCSCGNRPERPSRGHKWDPVEKKWAGKGHKQKGAGTTAISKMPVVTKVGKTKLEQWQKLPTQLLSDFCKKEKRPPFRLDPVDAKKNNTVSNPKAIYRYRVVVMDAKPTKRGPEFDLAFSPALPTDNEEQAKEEAAILALLHLTPKIPHDRKLPQPYKDIFLNALQHHKKKTAKPQHKSQNHDLPKPSVGAPKLNKESCKLSISSSSVKDVSKNCDTNKNNNTSTLAGSQNLIMDRQFASMAEKRRHDQQIQLEKKARIAKRELLKEANKPHRVLMSESLRLTIQKLLQSSDTYKNFQEGDVTSQENDPYIDNSLIEEVEKLLVEDGFSSKQIKMAIFNINLQQKKISQRDGQYQALDKMSLYEKSLQWLCIQLHEKFLPERFNPKDGNLDVIAAAPSTLKFGGQNQSNSPDIVEISKTFGVLNEEAALLMKISNSKNFVPEIFWKSIRNAGMKPELCTKDTKEDEIKVDIEVINLNLEQTNDEIEALQAIFPDECDVVYEKGNKKDVGQNVIIRVPLNTDQNKIDLQSKSPPALEFHVKNGFYPSVYPSRVFIKNVWKKESQSRGMGTLIHMKLIEFMTSLHTGEPMVYEIYSFVNDLLEQQHESFTIKSPLLSYLKEGGEKHSCGSRQSSSQNQSSKGQKNFSRRKLRPRVRSAFWSKHSNETPPALSFPKISSSIENARKNLPANAAREEFFEVLHKSQKCNRVMLVTGETGCGKTTQIPQFILEKYPADAKIVIAQPRRLAATGVAGRVAVERGEDEPGQNSVGYVVRGDSALCDQTRLLFCTTGVLLRQLQAENALECITHIVVDEVHERHLDTDILLGILKEALPKTPHLHVILMSATMDADRFAAYWGKNTPRMHIPGFTYPIQDHTLEDVLSLTGYIPPRKSKKPSQRAFQDPLTLPDNIEPQNDLDELVSRVQENIIDYEMLASLVKQLVRDKKYDDDGAVLVFLPGAPEISKAEQTIRRHTKNLSVQLLPLHGGLQPKDQKLVFKKPKLGLTKVVLSTNVAETSITIPDITIVIDTCKEKQSTYDPVNRMPMLVERFASRDSLRQRRGRSGRVRSGTCYKLISKKTFDKLEQHGEPEIRRCALDQTLLSLLFLGVERGSGTFMSKLLDPPSQAAIDAALFSLRKLGAVVESSKSGEVLLTPLGIHLAGIPAPPTIGKMLVVGSLLGCRSAALIMAAGMTVGRSPFSKVDVFKNQKPKKYRLEEESGIDPEEEHRKEMEEMRQQKIIESRTELLSRVGKSDHAMLAAAYMKWNSMDSGRNEYCQSLGINPNGMRDIKQLVNQLDGSLKTIGFHPSREADMNTNSWKIIRACVVAALAPSQIVRVHRPITKYNETIEGAVQKDGDAKELKFYVRSEDIEEDRKSQNNRLHEGTVEQRVFMHPSSANFKVGDFSFPWLVYHELVRTSKNFLRDATECTSYAMLLFGGKIEIQAAKELVIIDDWVKLSANARIGALIGGLRDIVDELLAKKVANPRLDISSCDEMKLIVDLIVNDGLLK